MAKVGGGAAYQQLTVPVTETGENARAFGAMSAANRRNSDNINAQERARKDEAKEKKRKEDQERYDSDYEKYDVTNAGWDDLNSANIALSTQLINLEADYMSNAKQAALNNDQQGAEEWRNKAMMNRQLFRNDQAAMETHKANYDAFMKDTQEGNVSGYSKGFKNFYDVTYKGGKMLKTVEDGKIIHVTEIEGADGEKQRQIVSANDVLSGSWRYYKKQDMVKDTKSMSAILGKIERKDVNGYITTETTEWDDGEENGIHTKAAMEAINAKVGDVAYMSDMVDQMDLYEEFGIDRNNPPVNRKFSPDEKKVVADRLLNMVRSSYNEKYEDTFNSSKYSTDVSAATRSDKKKDPDGLSNLHYDAQRFEGGDNTGLLGRSTDALTNQETTIVDVIPSADPKIVIAVTADGDRIEIPKTKRGFLEFKLRGNPEYKNITPEQVLEMDTSEYRQGSVGVSKVTDVVGKQYSAEGAFIGSEKTFVSQLKRLYPSAKIETAILGTDAIKVNGTTINLENTSKGDVEKAISKALGTSGAAQAPSGGTVR